MKTGSNVRVFASASVCIFLIAVFNCATVPRYEEVQASAKSSLNDAEVFFSQKKNAEAAELLRAVLKVYPENERAKALYEKLPPESKEAVSEISYLGPNRGKREAEESSLLAKFAWYLPDRILDLLDILSVNVKVGPQFGVSAWVTRGFQVTLYTGNTVQLGWFQKRNLGYTEELSAEAGLGPVVPISISGRSMGTGSKDAYESFVFHSPRKKIYQNYRDYWGMGVKAGVVMGGLEVEVHWLEFFDFLAGIFTFDLLYDDLAKTRSLNFTSEQERKLYLLNTADRILHPAEIREIRREFPDLNDSEKKEIFPSENQIEKVPDKNPKKR
ncbi:hypothetical protein EHO60_01850 [Leptospira fletcheri]|uniref:Lipoprotein n=1 Tax=Leptospira fletcheri TaxID=2484981 RepID=A0A4R9GL64_9LEPT|nr:hypothetical protein [Leptospira fletcheri]TGK14111.1 hypothetical protein EHO60_01850 [Leptospira fletcheri]